MVTLLQTEKMYEVIFQDKEYTVILLADPKSDYFEYTVFDDENEIVEGDEEVEVVDYLESQI